MIRDYRVLKYESSEVVTLVTDSFADAIKSTKWRCQMCVSPVACLNTTSKERRQTILVSARVSRHSSRRLLLEFSSA